MDKELSTIVLVLITGLVLLAVAQPIIPTNNQPFSELGTLNSQKLVGPYPTNIVSGENFSLYIYIGNHEGVTEYYQLLVKLANSSTTLSNSTYVNAPVLSSYSYVLENNQNVTIPITMSINQTGVNLRLIFELWNYNITSSTFSYTGLRNSLILNVTKS